MTAEKGGCKIESATAHIDSIEVQQLNEFLYALGLVNGGMFPPSVHKWVAKNQNAIKVVMEKTKTQTTLIHEKYFEFAPEGQKGFTYHQRGVPFETEGDKDGAITRVVRGDRGYRNPDGTLTSIYTGKKIHLDESHPDCRIQWDPVIKEGEENNFHEAMITEMGFKHEVCLYKIDSDSLEFKELKLPSLNSQGNALNLPLVYSCIIDDQE